MARQLRIALWGAGLLATASLWSPAGMAQVANFHPCNADPSLPICLHGYGRRVAVARWGAQPEPIDADAAATASLTTRSPAGELKRLTSRTILVQDMDTAEILFSRGDTTARPIASITKLMTALVVLHAGLPLDEPIRIDASDVDVPSELPSRLSVGQTLTRKDLLHLALIASENSAAHALGRSHPGGMPAFVAAMNVQARALGMRDTRFVEPVGLSSENVASTRDLARLVHAASQQPLIHAFTTEPSYQAAGQTFHNTNMLVGRPRWNILASKTGTTREAGNCLVMMLRLDDRNLAMVLLDARGMNRSRFGDAVRLRRVLSPRPPVASATAKASAAPAMPIPPAQVAAVEGH